jgi:hypothetical protein
LGEYDAPEGRMHADGMKPRGKWFVAHVSGARASIVRRA